jgi:DNA-directed RNA polymerase I, II, and III subunit RPABC1
MSTNTIQDKNNNTSEASRAKPNPQVEELNLKEGNRQLQPIYATEADVIKRVKENTFIMLSRRIYVKDNVKYPLLSYDDAIKNVKDLGDNVFKVTGNENKTYAVKIILHKVASMSKYTAVTDFIDKHSDSHRIIVVGGYNSKSLDDVHKKQGIEIFLVEQLLSNLLDHVIQPKFELLTPDEMKKVREEYNMNDKQIQHMLKSDPITQYFNLKRGDIIRVIRHSPTSLKVPAYRVVT